MSDAPIKKPPKPPCVIGLELADEPQRDGAALVLSCLLGPVTHLSQLLTNASILTVKNG